MHTLGKRGDLGNLLPNKKQLKAKGATFYKINCGAEIFYHIQGKIIGHPILDLKIYL